MTFAEATDILMRYLKALERTIKLEKDQEAKREMLYVFDQIGLMFLLNPEADIILVAETVKEEMARTVSKRRKPAVERKRK